MIRLIIIGGLGIIGYLFLFSQDTLITMTQREALKKALGDINKAPDFTLTAMNDSVYNLRKLEDKVVLINFWATWCGPCKIEVPWFVEFAEQYRDAGLVVVGLSVDDTADRIEAFVDEYDVNYPMLVGLGREDFQEAYGPIWGVPMTFFIDREGTVCRTHAGIATRDELEKDITDLL